VKPAVNLFIIYCKSKVETAIYTRILLRNLDTNFLVFMGVFRNMIYGVNRRNKKVSAMVKK
jgi:hypothetical protein